MSWTKRSVVALPLAIAASLNLLMVAVGTFHLRREHLAGYGFLFASPCAWLIDHLWSENGLHRLLGPLAGYVIILWIPAVLYAACLWLLFIGIRIGVASRSRRWSVRP
jgi:hypothetical protein